MLVGILSDTHDSVSAMDAAMALLRQQGADVYLHCGDVGGHHILDRLAGLDAHFVFGNNDWEHDSLRSYAEKLQITLHGGRAELELADKKLLMVYGDDLRAMDRAISQQRFDYVFHGHTHQTRDERVGKTRVINPGALFRARQKTVATLHLPSDCLTFFPVNVGTPPAVS